MLLFLKVRSEVEFDVVIAKPVAHTVSKKPMETKKEVIEQPKPVKSSGKKWNVLKPIEAKSVTEIQKEMDKKG